MENYIVYMHENRINHKKYIGITCQNPNRRWQNGFGYKRNEHFYNAILKYGWDTFNHYILFTDLTKEGAEQKEVELIAKYKTSNRKFGYNLTNGGECIGKHTKETCIKISKQRLGKHLTKETKEKISNAIKGNKNPMFGKVGKDNSISKTVICLETGIEYCGIHEASRKTGIAHSGIVACCKGRLKTAGKKHWKYKEEVSM